MISAATTPEDFGKARQLVREYIDWLPFELDFQDYESELADLSNHYAAPEGTLLLAYDPGGEAIGTVGVRRWGDGIAELKRMYLRPDGRGAGVGRRLAEAAIEFARGAGYTAIRLDSDQASMPEANRLYESLGFLDIESYRSNDLPCARFMELKL